MSTFGRVWNPRRDKKPEHMDRRCPACGAPRGSSCRGKYGQSLKQVRQEEYVPVPAVYVDTTARPMVTRWRLSQEERDAITDGADVVLQQLTFGQPFQPVNLQVVHPGDMPVLCEDPTPLHGAEG